MQRQSPIIIAHRGASGYLPEHTLEAYAFAMELGADYIEPDLVATKDGFLVARHEPNLIASTDVEDRSEFAARRRVALIDGIEEEGFFASDFTLAEIKTLGAAQQFAERSHAYDGKFKIPTFDEIIALAQRASRRTGRAVGVYPETKHPSYHRALDLALEDQVLLALDKAGWNHRAAPVFIQSFETANLKYLRSKTPVHLVQLIGASEVNPDGSLSLKPPSDRPYDWRVAGNARLSSDMVTPLGLAEIATYADAIGPWKRFIVSTAGAGTNNDEAERRTLPPSPLIGDAHRAGLRVHAYTFRNEAHRLASDYGARPVDEYVQFYALGIDGVFSDFPDTAVSARKVFELLSR
jgi:glycerophosphoryl diester phosphodiesterase